MILDSVLEEKIWPLLDLYKGAWMKKPDLSDVQILKEELLAEAKLPGDEYGDYFLEQCFQVEGRWSRPHPQN